MDRCRIFGPHSDNPEMQCFELWDTLENPYEIRGGTMPPGEPLFTATHQSFEVVREEVETYKAQSNNGRCCDWDIRGII